MKVLLALLIIISMSFAEEFKDIKYEIIAENARYITVLIEEKGTKDAQTTLDYILAAEVQYNIEFVSAVTAYAFIFKKRVKK